MKEKPRDIGERTKMFALRREGKRSRSDVELISKIEGGLQELEESVYWLAKRENKQ